MSNTSKRGFASMDNEKQRIIASKGGKAAHAKGTAHEWSPDEARAAGRKGGESRGSRTRTPQQNILAGASSMNGSNARLEPASGVSNNAFLNEAGSSLRRNEGDNGYAANFSAVTRSNAQGEVRTA
jgi:general stress protein YciG